MKDCLHGATMVGTVRHTCHHLVALYHSRFLQHRPSVAAESRSFSIDEDPSFVAPNILCFQRYRAVSKVTSDKVGMDHFVCLLA